MELIGRTLGQYQLVEIIHQGDNVVCKGFQPSQNRYVAVKVLAPGQAAKQAFVQQFQQDMQLVTALKHPNVLPVLDYGYQDGILYMVTEYVEGGSLRDQIPQRFTSNRVQEIIQGVAAGLDFIHSRGVTYGNLKPSNVLIDSQGQPLLTDFGYTQGIDLSAQENAYLSPEQMQGSMFDRRTDIYALGMLLYELLTGETPPPGTVPSPRQTLPEMTQAVEMIILKALAANPDQRYQTAEELSAALDQAMGGPAGQATRVAAPVAKPVLAPTQRMPEPSQPTQTHQMQQPEQAKPMRLPLLIGGVAIAALLVAVLCGLVFFSNIFGGGSDGGNSVGTPITGGGVIIIVPTPKPNDPMVTATANVNIRSGPGMQYDVIGLLKAGQTASVIGVSQDGGWWAIHVPAADNDQGWVSGQYVQAVNVENVPVLPAPTVPTPTTAPPIVITDWQGDYFDNANLRGDPVLVRNDKEINFDWGDGSPGPEVPADNFSARWTYSRDIPAGIYRFSIWADNGVRLFIDDNLAIDAWQEGPIRNHVVDAQLGQGTHTVRLEYFHATGYAMINMGIGYSPVEATPAPPKAAINGTTEGFMGQTVSFTARNSSVSPGSHLVTFEWDFDDGASASGVDVSHVYNAPGTYEVSLTVTDDKGLSDTDVQQIVINDAPEPDEPPIASISGPAQAFVGDNVTFDASSSVCSGQCVSYAWDLGDGSTANAVLINHVYNNQGIYNVVLTVTDDKGLQGLSNIQVQIDPTQVVPPPTDEPQPTDEPDQPPLAVINGPDQAVVGQEIIFDASQSQEGSGGPIVDYTWDFGDDTTATGSVVTHTYLLEGDFQIVLEVIDESGVASDALTNITVSP